MSDIATRQIGGRIYIYRGADDMLGWLDREFPKTAYRKRSGDGSVYRRDTEWTGRWTAFVNCDRTTHVVTSPAEGMLLIARVTELHETEPPKPAEFVDKITEYGMTQRLTRAVRVF